MSWWVLSSESLREMLHRVAAGEDPEMVYVEFWANCEHEEYTNGEAAEDPA